MLDGARHRTDIGAQLGFDIDDDSFRSLNRAGAHAGRSALDDVRYIIEVKDRAVSSPDCAATECGGRDQLSLRAHTDELVGSFDRARPTHPSRMLRCGDDVGDPEAECPQLRRVNLDLQLPHFPTLHRDAAHARDGK